MKVFALPFLVALTSVLLDTVSGECADKVTKLDLSTSTVETNTLHEGGELRYGSEYKPE
jgi:hypothetical protein